MKSLPLSCVLAVIVSAGALGPVRAESRQEVCDGILHRDGDGLRFGGNRGEGEDICFIGKSKKGRVLAVCAVGRFCRVAGIVDACKDSGECIEMTTITSVRARK